MSSGRRRDAEGRLRVHPVRAARCAHVLPLQRDAASAARGAQGRRGGVHRQPGEVGGQGHGQPGEVGGQGRRGGVHGQPGEVGGQGRRGRVHGQPLELNNTNNTCGAIW